MLGAQADPKDVTLPPAGEREWLIGQTAKLLAVPGHVSAYLRAPLLEPTPAYFPDRWGGGEASVRRLLLRLLRYAGHAEHDVAVVIHEEDPARRGEVLAKPAPMRGKDPVAWFVRRDGDVLRFACELSILREPENLVPALARAVAHAHRVLAGLEHPDNQRLIDVTGVLLGFGLLTTDACQRFYARNDGGFRATRAEFRLGALSVQDMSFLLAMQLEARGVDRRTRRRLLAKQQPNQAGFVREAQAWLAQLQPGLRGRLGLPLPTQWPAPPDLRALTGPLGDPRRKVRPEQLIAGSGVFAGEELDDGDGDGDGDGDDDDEPRRDIDLGIRGANRGKPVFRIERSGALRMAKLLGFPVLLVGGLLSRGNFGVDVPMQIVAPVAVCLAVLGLGVGSLFTDRRCSEPKCGAKLSETDEVCPLCGGVVMEVIHHPRERLGAEEELAREGRITAEGLVAGWEEEEDEDEDEDEDEEEDDDDPDDDV
ncbi:hypothetical protein DB30_00840 [Enhygromyxa salina]|uniref:Uncharacterized protein n=1 Tax=Enhygromyxa salina TaxID=215803 RepID=A0A0C2CNZ8_9BACT|nr:zinc ribbon domain-containing protein [Enhygromyxa salina]KIG12956.1 hypothetical protein DB30_00840 [Enhygromyxa salina]